MDTEWGLVCHSDLAIVGTLICHLCSSVALLEWPQSPKKVATLLRIFRDKHHMLYMVTCPYTYRNGTGTEIRPSPDQYLTGVFFRKSIPMGHFGLGRFDLTPKK